MNPFDIKPYHAGPTPFAPRIDIDEYGLKIFVPSPIVFTPGGKSQHDQAFTYIPVSLAYRAPAYFTGRMFPELETILYIATDAQRGVTFVGNGMRDRILLRPPPKEVPHREPAAHVAHSHGGWYTINLAQQANLPARAATYWIHAAFGPYLSNVVRVEVRERSGGNR